MESGVFGGTRSLDVLAGVVVVAALVAVDPWGAFAFGPLRWTLLSTGLLALGAAVASRPALAWSPALTRLWIALLGVLLVATVTGVEPVHGWIGTPDRRLGLVTFVLFFVAALAGQQMSVETVAKVISGVGAVLGLYVVAELFGLAPVDVDDFGSRLGGPFGQPAYLGASATLILPVSVAVAIAVPGRWRVVSTVSSSGAFLALLGAQTRGAWAGAIVAVGAAAWTRRRDAPRILGSLGVATIVAVSIPELRGRLASMFDVGGAGAQARFDEWSLGLYTLSGNLPLGLGPEGYRTAVVGHIDVDYAVMYGREVLPDRAHNGLIDMLNIGGVGAGALYVALVVALMRAAWRAMATGDVVLVGASAALVAYVAQQQFLFPLAEVDPVFWLLAGTVVAADASGRGRLRFTRRRRPLLTAAPLVALAGAALVTGALDVAADRALDDALSVASADPVGAAAHAEAATEHRADSIRYRFAAARLAGRLDLSGDVAALEHVDDGLDISPHDPALLRERSTILLRIARATGDERDLERATASLAEAVGRDPTHPAIRLEYGTALAVAGNLGLAEEQFEAVLAVDPDSAAAAENLRTLRARLAADDGG